MNNPLCLLHFFHVKMIGSTAEQAHRDMQTLVCTNTARRECFLAERSRVHLLAARTTRGLQMTTQSRMPCCTI